MSDISKIVLNGVEYDLKDSTARTDLATALARLSTLLTELQANPDYAPTAEVVDIRTAYDGTVYEFAGDAVRALGQQLSEFKEKFGDNLYFGWKYENSVLELTLNGNVCSDPVTIVSGGSGGSANNATMSLKNTGGWVYKTIPRLCGPGGLDSSSFHCPHLRRGDRRVRGKRGVTYLLMPPKAAGANFIRNNEIRYNLTKNFSVAVIRYNTAYEDVITWIIGRQELKIWRS